MDGGEEEEAREREVLEGGRERKKEVLCTCSNFEVSAPWIEGFCIPPASNNILYALQRLKHDAVGLALYMTLLKPVCVLKRFAICGRENPVVQQQIG